MIWVVLATLGIGRNRHRRQLVIRYHRCGRCGAITTIYCTS